MARPKAPPAASALVGKFRVEIASHERREKTTLRALRGLYELAGAAAIEAARDAERRGAAYPDGAGFRNAAARFAEAVRVIDDHLFLGWDGLASFFELYGDVIEAARASEMVFRDLP